MLMNEIEKMYENAQVKPICDGLDCWACTAKYNNGKCPEFTAEKQIELIKWLLYHELIDYLKMSYTSEEGGILDISIKCMSGYSYSNDDDDDFDIALASLINRLWQDLTEEEKQQIKEILE